MSEALGNPRSESIISRDREAAIAWAREVLEDERTVILDTETTGLYPPVVFVEIGVVDRMGRQLFHSLVKPQCRITPEAGKVHGYTMEDLEGMPTFDDLFPALYGLLYERRVVVWNAAYDRMVFDYAASGYMHAKRDSEPPDLAPWECAMRRHAEYAGDWSEEKQSYRWHRLEGGDHTAIGDAKAALRTMRAMAEEL